MTKILCAMPEGTYKRMMTPEREEELRALGEVTFCKNPRELSEEEYGALWKEVDAVVTGWGLRAPTPATLDAASRLKIITHTAGSVRGLPRYALERGIVITSVRAAMARTVGEFCLMNALVLLRRLPFFIDTDVGRKQYFAAGSERPTNETLFGKTVGLVGFGCVGQCFRALLQPFGCRVLAYDPYMTEKQAAEHQVELTDLPTLLRSSKIVSLHVPDIPATNKMIGARELAYLADGAIFLNSARGRVVDTEALTAALRTGRFSAAIDVTDPEPLPPDHPLRTMPNVLFTPHIAGPTEDELPELTRVAFADLGRFLRGEPPLYPISLEAYDIMSF